MAHILPNVDKLEAMVKALRTNAKSKKQEAVAEEIIEQYSNLIEYTKYITKICNESDDHSEPDYANPYWWDIGEG